MVNSQELLSCDRILMSLCYSLVMLIAQNLLTISLNY